MSVLTLTKANFQDTLAKNATVAVDFWASWCSPCRMLSPVIDEIAEELQGSVTVGKVNIDEEADLAAQFHVMSIPTVIVFQNGKEVQRSVGVQPKAHLLQLMQG